MGTQGHRPPWLPPMPGTLGPSRCCVSCLFSGWYVSNCVSLLIGSCDENNKNPIPLLLLWKTGTKKTWGRLFIRKATSASREGGGQGAEKGGAHKSITVVSRWAWKMTPGVSPPMLQGWAQLWTELRWWLQGPCLPGRLSTTAALESEVAQRGDACVHTPPSPGEAAWGPSSSSSASLCPPSVTAAPSGPGSWIFLTSAHFLEPDPALL